MRASQTAELAFDGCVVPLDALLGEENRGAAYAGGASRAALDATLEYVKQRQQFGQPVGKFQGVQWMLADMATALEAARPPTHPAAGRAPPGLPPPQENSNAK